MSLDADEKTTVTTRPDSSWQTVPCPWLLMMWNNLPPELLILRQSCCFATDFDHILLQLVNILNTLFKYWVSYRQLTFITEMFESLVKNCKVCFVIREYSVHNCMFTWKLTSVFMLSVFICWSKPVVSIKFAGYVWTFAFRFWNFGSNLRINFWGIVFYWHIL